MVEGILRVRAASYEYAEIGAGLLLANELGQALRAQR